MELLAKSRLKVLVKIQSVSFGGQKILGVDILDEWKSSISCIASIRFGKEP